MLRNLLRLHPNLACPEETHIFRWPEPFAGSRFTKIIEENPTLNKHRQMDGILDADFRHLLESARSRKDLQDGYGEMFLEKNAMSQRRWFDKTPQNSYGLLLLNAFYPDSKILHIHRHPYNVVASLKLGKVMPEHDLISAINTWLESVLILNRFRAAWPELVLDIAYESLTVDPGQSLQEILAFIDEPDGLIPFDSYGVHPEQNKYREVLSAAEMDTIASLLAEQMTWFGYE